MHHVYNYQASPTHWQQQQQRIALAAVDIICKHSCHALVLRVKLVQQTGSSSSA
jgi:hypothetical protein